MPSRLVDGAKAWSSAIREDLRVEPSEADQRWSNKDLEPTPPERRVFHWYNYLLYFIGTGFNNWAGGSSVIGVGLGWKAAIALTFAANIIAGMAVAANCKAAARYHVGFPAIARSVYGMWGSSYQVGVRAILAAVWYATQIYSGASYLGVMLTAVFGTHFTSIPNHVPESIGYTTQDFLCYFLVWLIYLPVLLRRPHQMRWLFGAACVLSFPSILALFGYCMVQSGGRIGLDDHFGSATTASTQTSSQRAWQIVYALTSTISNGSPYIESIPDMARWAHSPVSPIFTTLFTNSVFNPLSAVFGILGTSALQVAIGQTLWTPWDIMTYMLTQHTSAAGRFGVFCLAFTWLVQTLSQNVSSNMIPFGADTSMLCPRYINMTRGYLIVHVLAWVICPWKIYESAGTFLDFMGAYGIFMGPAISIMLCEYYVFSRGNLFVPSLYDGSSTNKHYWYSRGWNVQAYIAYIVAVGLCFVGFVNKVGATVPQVGVELGYLGWFLTFSTGWIVYYVVVKVWPHQNVQYTRNLKWEELAATDYGVAGVLNGVPAYVSDEERQESVEVAKPE